MKKEIGAFCEVLNGYAFKSNEYINAGARVMRITNVQKGSVIDDDPKYYAINDSLEKYALAENDLLMSLTGNVGRVGLISKRLLPAYLNQRVACLRLKDNNIDIGYLFHCLNSDIFENDAINSARGIAQLNMSTEWLKTYEIPLLPLSEQRHITAVLDKVCSLIADRKRQLEQLDMMVKARFTEMFGNMKNNENNWDIVPFPSVATIDTHMTSDFHVYAGNPHIGIENIEKETGALVNYKTVEESGLISGKYPFDVRHIIYSKIRPNLNKVALPTFKGLCSADAYPILPKSNCNRVYLAMIMRSDFFLDYILEHSGRTNIPKVNKTALNGFILPLPPLELQNTFADFVQSTGKSKTEIKQGLTQLELQYNALMQQYFGE